MKLKNYYIGILVVWAIISLCDSVACAVNIINGNTVKALLFLILSVAFAFVSGKLYVKAQNIADYNRSLERMEQIIKISEKVKQERENEPFKEFEVPFPEVRKEK
jgi:ABC-type transport system involved in cytochrome bd biosynthesis fused ATPase/permease subunit